jgi:hypothetical protein
MFDMKLIPCFPAIINQPLRLLARSAKVWGLACVMVLCGCSMAVSGYNNAPQLLMYLWIDPHLDLNKAQKKQTLTDLENILHWHRQHQLPQYAEVLSQMQKLAPTHISPTQVCDVVDQVSDLMEDLTFQLEEPLARLALSLTPAQLQTLRKKYLQDWRDYRKEWKLDASAQLQLEVQTDKGQTNAERLYGRLSPAQEKLLRQLAQQSGYEGERTYAERVRLQKANLAMHESIAQTKPSLEQAKALVHAWLQNSIHTPDAAYAAYLKKRKQTNCEAAAVLHNTTTAEQRARAVRVLKDYEDDIKALMQQKPS